MDVNFLVWMECVAPPSCTFDMPEGHALDCLVHYFHGLEMNRRTFGWASRLSGIRNVTEKMAVVVGLHFPIEPERHLGGAFERQHSKENVRLISLMATAGPENV